MEGSGNKCPVVTSSLAEKEKKIPAFNHLQQVQGCDDGRPSIDWTGTICAWFLAPATFTTVRSLPPAPLLLPNCTTNASVLYLLRTALHANLIKSISTLDTVLLGVKPALAKDSWPRRSRCIVVAHCHVCWGKKKERERNNI